MEIMMSILSLILKILVAILIFGLIIFVHELGHFIMAKLMGVKVNEFAMGMGPKLLQFGKRKPSTPCVFFLSAVFALWRVRMRQVLEPLRFPKRKNRLRQALSEPSLVLQEQETVKPKKESRAFCDKKVWQGGVLIVIAGATMNLNSGICLACGLFWSLLHAQ